MAATARGKHLMIAGGLVLLGGVAPWVYWIGAAMDGGRGAIRPSLLTALAGLAIMAGLIMGVVGLVLFLVTRRRR